MSERKLTGSGHKIHIYNEGGEDWIVWLNTVVQDFDGLCLGTGRTRKDALIYAINSLEYAIKTLEELKSADK